MGAEPAVSDRFIGGGTIRLDGVRLAASWPTLRLTLLDTGLLLELRGSSSRFMRMWLSIFGVATTGRDNKALLILWAEIDRIDYTVNSIAVYPERSEPVRFVMRGDARAQVERILTACWRHGAQYQEVHSTAKVAWK